MAAEPKTGAIIAKCRADVSCGYAWIVVFLPMQLDKVAQSAMRHSCCPMCGDGKPLLGNPSDLDPTLRAHLYAMTACQP